jgi:tetratricopeptide (TPR) repeat protein
LEYLTGKPGNPTGTRQDVENLLHELENPGILLVLDGFERALRVFRSMDAAYQEDDKTKTENEHDTGCVSPLAEDFLKGVSTLPELQGKVLMTTRLRPRILTGHGGMLLTGCEEKELTALDKADAVDFFRHLGINGTRAEIQSACDPYGYHPLSLRLLSGLIVKDFEHPRDISVAQKFNIIGDLKQRQHHVLEQSYNSLTPERQRLFSRIACFRGSIDYKALKAIAEQEETFDTDIHDLVERGLLHHTELDNKFDLHPIVRRFAYDRLTAADRTGAHQRLVNYFEAVPKIEKVQTLEDLGPVIELYHHMVRAGKLDEALELFSDRLHDQMYYQFGAYQIIVELLQALFLDGEDKPPRLKEESDQAWILAALANAYSLSGQPRRAVPLFELTNDIYENKMKNKQFLAIGLGNVAQQQLVIGALKEAERNLRRYIELSIELGIEAENADAYQELGRVLSYRGAWQEAGQELDLSFNYDTKQNDYQGLSVDWSYRALRFLLMRREDHQSLVVNLKSSIESASRALELANEDARTVSPVPRDYIRAYWLLGAAYRANNDLTQAEENLSKAISMCRQINDVMEEADILLDLGRLRYDQKNYEEAKSLAEEALSITGRCGYVLQGADVNLFLAQYSLTLPSPSGRGVGVREIDKAREYAQTALKLARCDGPPYYYKVAYDEAQRLLEKLK